MKLLKLVVSMAVIVAPMLADAARQDGVGKTMLTQEGLHGGCGFTMSTDTNYADTLNPADQDGACGNNWLTADCDANRISKSQSRINWNMVQLAAVTGRPIRAFFTAPTVDGKCVLQRIDVLPPS